MRPRAPGAEFDTAAAAAQGDGVWDPLGRVL